MRQWLKRIGLGVLALVVLVLLVGTGYEAYSRHLARSEFPPNGRMIDVGGRRMHLDCRGQNEPTVVFEAGPVAGTSPYVVGARAADRAPHPELRAELARLRDLGYLAG